jgi:hypothetical protein
MAINQSFRTLFVTSRGPCGIVIYSYNKTKEMHWYLKFIFGIELYMFRKGILSIIRNLVFNIQMNRNVQHNHFLFIVYRATCFDLQSGHHQAYIRICHRLLCTYWDPNVCTMPDFVGFLVIILELEQVFSWFSGFTVRESFQKCSIFKVCWPVTEAK